MATVALGHLSAPARAQAELDNAERVRVLRPTAGSTITLVSPLAAADDPLPATA